MFHQVPGVANNVLPANGNVGPLGRKDPSLSLEYPRTLHSEELFNGQRLVLIEHAGQHYRLLTTRIDRLILQK